jgi:hypothetical protein
MCLLATLDQKALGSPNDELWPLEVTLTSGVSFNPSKYLQALSRNISAQRGSCGRGLFFCRKLGLVFDGRAGGGPARLEPVSGRRGCLRLRVEIGLESIL